MESLPFLEDIYPQNLLYAAVIRSPVAKGRLIKIETPELPEQFKMLTAKDIPGENKLFETDVPILTDEKLFYIGEPVAVLLGHDKIKLEDLAAKCAVIAEEETPVFTFIQTDQSDVDQHEAEKPQVFQPMAIRELTIGQPRQDSENKNKIVSGSFSTGIQDHWYAEPQGAVTWYLSKGKANSQKSKKNSPLKPSEEGQTIVVRTATQWPNHVKQSVARVLSVDASSVLVEPTSLNLHMDGKLWYPSLIACISALGTFITKKPVRFILNKDEDFLYTPKRCGANIDIQSVIDEKGNITSSNIDILVNLGAYGVNEKEILDQICLGSLGLYKFNNLKLTAKAYRTNLPVQGAFSGFGLAQGLFAIERHISQIADTVNIDPADLRKSAVNPNVFLSSKNTTTGAELIEAATKMSDYYRKWSSNELLRQNRRETFLEKGEQPRGIGIAAGFQGNGLLYYGKDNGAYTAEATLTKDSILEIKTNIVTPENYQKIWQKIAAEIISIQPDNVRVVTEDAPDCGPSCASRNITAVTRLVEKCCYAIRKQHFRDPLPITVRRSIKPQSGSIRYDNWEVMDTTGFIKPSLAAAVIEVTVDLIECTPKIRGIWLAVDGGKIISKHRAKRSVTRAVIQALGWALSENIEYINGVIPRKQYDNFSLFSLIDTPPIEIEFLSTDTNESKGISELPFTCIPAAFIQAVSQAMDYSFKSLPLKRKDIWEMVKTKNYNSHAAAKPHSQAVK